MRQAWFFLRSGWAVALMLFFPSVMAFSWVNGDGFRSIELAPEGGKAGLTLLPPSQTGVWFTNRLEGDMALTNAVAHNGAGLALGDIDGDGWVDLYLCSLEGPNRLYRNLGEWRFQELNPGEAACADQLSTGAAFADVDGDGDLDLLVNGIAAGTRLFLNDGKGVFVEVDDSGLSRTASATSLALADIDGDGDLDLYCTHYIDVMHLADPTTRFAMARRGDQWEVAKVNGQSTRLPKWKDRFQALPDGRVRELPEADGFYRNDGHGHFTPIQNEPGVFMDSEGKAIPPFRDWGLSVMFRDLDGDGAPDFYVCNDNASPDRVWMNSGRGTFRLMDPARLRHSSRSSMAIDFADLDRDARDDFIVLDMLARDPARRLMQLVRDYPDPHAKERIDEQPRYNRNTLFFGCADGSYAEAAFMAGVAATDWSWCPVFIDLDLDGYEDLLVANGFSFDVMDQDSHDLLRRAKRNDDQLKRSRQAHPRWPTRNAAFRNRGNGLFDPMEVGFDHMGISYGMALADLDNDGDLDVVVNNLNEAASLYRNDTKAPRVAVRLHGSAPNTQGIGARLRLISSRLTQSQEMICGGRYLSSDQAMRVFAAKGEDGKAQRLEVRWRNGEVSALDVLPNRVYEISQAGAKAAASIAKAPDPEPFFTDASALLNHVHVEDAFDDWAIQPLLPRRLSRLGPGLSWFDLDGDGWEDLIVTAARGGKPAFFLNEQGRQFRKDEGIVNAGADQGAVVGWTDGLGNRGALVALSDYGMSPPQQAQIARYTLKTMAAPPVLLPAGEAALGPLALADIDGDGDLDLFVGGRCRPGHYPEPVSSGLWLNEQGALRRSAELSQSFASVGMVSGATFCDLDGDGQPDLALALEWGPVRIFHNEKGRFKDVTAELGLAQTAGWWTSVTAGDFDGDGRLDLAVGNWGHNSFYELYRPGPFRIFYDDWNGDGRLDLIEAWQKDGTWLPVRNRLWLERGWPEIKERFATHALFAKASVPELLADRFAPSRFVEAGEFESGVFLNRGSHFDWIPFPRDAQLSPVFAISVADFDGDGRDDLFLGQNFFGSASDLSRDDSGQGLWLRGAGTGQFTAMDSRTTGVRIDGEQRSAALADFNHDGRVDLAVSQNNAETKLFLNRRAKQGLRVLLEGPAGNPDAIGARTRVRYAQDRSGPCRAIQAGSGYWSQDAAVQVLGLAEAPVELWIAWPGGKEQTVSLKPDAHDVRVRLEP